MSDVLLGQSYYLRFDEKLFDAMQPYPPLGTLYAASFLRARGYAVGLNQDDLTITPVYNSAAETITVTGLYEFKTASPILRLIFNADSYTLHAAVRMGTEE